MSNPDLEPMMNEFADDAVTFARDEYQEDLDYSEDSLKQVEDLLSKLYTELQKSDANPVSEHQVLKQRLQEGFE